MSSPLQGPDSISSGTIPTSIATEWRRRIIHVFIARMPTQPKTCDYTGIAELGVGSGYVSPWNGNRTFTHLLLIVLLAHTHTCEVFEVLFTLGVPRDVIYKHFAFVCFVFHGAPPVPYVQVAILNLPIPNYIVLHVPYFLILSPTV